MLPLIPLMALSEPLSKFIKFVLPYLALLALGACLGGSCVYKMKQSKIEAQKDTIAELTSKVKEQKGLLEEATKHNKTLVWSGNERVKNCYELIERLKDIGGSNASQNFSNYSSGSSIEQLNSMYK